MIAQQNLPEKMNRKQAAVFLGVSYAFLAADAVTKRHGVPHYKIGRRCVYDRANLDVFLAEHRIGGVPDAK